MFLFNIFKNTHKETDKKMPPGHCGLYNLGNTCYMNSVLQSLAHTPFFIENINTKQIIPQNAKTAIGREGRYKQLSDALIDLMICMNSQKYSICTTHAIKNFSGKMREEFAGSKQSDASEFFMFLLDQFENEIKEEHLTIEIILPKDARKRRKHQMKEIQGLNDLNQPSKLNKINELQNLEEFKNVTMSFGNVGKQNRKELKKQVSNGKGFGTPQVEISKNDLNNLNINGKLIGSNQIAKIEQQIDENNSNENNNENSSNENSKEVTEIKEINEFDFVEIDQNEIKENLDEKLDKTKKKKKDRKEKKPMIDSIEIVQGRESVGMSELKEMKDVKEVIDSNQPNDSAEYTDDSQTTETCETVDKQIKDVIVEIDINVPLNQSQQNNSKETTSTENTIKSKDEIEKDEEFEENSKVELDENKFRMSCDNYREFVEKNPSLTNQIFYGMMARKTTCPNCKYVSMRHEPFSVLPVTIPVPDGSIGYFPVIFIGVEGKPKRFFVKTTQRPRVEDIKRQIEEKMKKKVFRIWCYDGRHLPDLSLTKEQIALDLRGHRSLIAYEDCEDKEFLKVYIKIGNTKRTVFPLLVGKQVRYEERLRIYQLNKPYSSLKHEKRCYEVEFNGNENDYKKLNCVENVEELREDQELLQTGNISLEWCLEQEFAEARCEHGSEWKCHECQKIVEPIRSQFIEYPPKILPITMSRFRQVSWNKVYKDVSLVTFPTELNLKKLGMDVQYSLYAIVNHKGSLTSGHYFAYCKCADGWKIFNDSSVEMLDTSILKEPSPLPYMLFYERKD